MTGTLHPHPDDLRPLDSNTAGATCQHPATRRFAWFARDDTAPGGQVLCVCCSDCGAVLQGGVPSEAQP